MTGTCFLLAGRYTLLEQAPLDDLLPLCVQRGTSIVIGGPLNSGILAGRDTWNYAAAPAEIVAKVQLDPGRVRCAWHFAASRCAAVSRSPTRRFCAIIPGPRSAAEFATNVPLFTQPVPPALWSDLKAAGLLHPDAPVPGG